MTYLSTNTPNMFDMMFAAHRAYFDMFAQMTRAMGPMSVRPSQLRSARQSDVGQREQVVGQREQVVGIGVESLNVGTRRISGEATRVRRVVRDMPVERRVELHDETITVERRPANGKVADHDALVEREYVMIDTREIPVVTKETHLREELVIRKERTGRVEVIRDTVRQADVEVMQPQRMPMVVALGDGEDKLGDGEDKKHGHREPKPDQQHHA